MKDKSVTFVVTEECQLRCKYCYLVGKNSHGRMSNYTARRIVDWVLSEELIKDADRVILDFIGGEPLLEIDLIKDTVSYAYEQMQKKKSPWADNFRIRITSNGISYNSPKVQEFIHKYKKQVDISISIDGTKEKHDENRIFADGKGSYTTILPNIKLWTKQFSRPATKMTISHEDLPYVKDSLIHLMHLGIKVIDVNPILEDVWEDGDDVILENQLMLVADYMIDHSLYGKYRLSCFDEDMGGKPVRNKRMTPCGDVAFAVDSQGDIFPCIRFKSYSLREKKQRSVGNLNSGVDMNLLRPFLLFDDTTSFPDTCLSCDVGNLCKWCPAESYDSSLTDTIFQRSTAHCNMYKAMVKANNYYQRKLNVINENYGKC